MKILSVIVIVASVAVMSASPRAQVKTIPGESKNVTVTVEGIEQSSRTLNVVDEQGFHKMIRVPTDVKRFNELKVGDKITTKYYDNVVVRLKKPGEQPVDVDAAAVTPTTGTSPGGTISTQRTITATVTAIDQTVPSITVKGPNGWLYSSKVADTKALANLKVGDQLDITWTDAVLISVESAAKPQ